MSIKIHTRSTLLFVALLLMVSTARSRAEEASPPNADALQWGMSRAQVIRIMGDPGLEALIYRAEFLDIPVTLECLLEDDKLVSRTLNPKRKQPIEQYQAEYKKLQVELRLALGEPIKNEEGLQVWGDAKTNTLFTLIFNGKWWTLHLEEWREPHE